MYNIPKTAFKAIQRRSYVYTTQQFEYDNAHSDESSAEKEINISFSMFHAFQSQINKVRNLLS